MHGLLSLSLYSQRHPWHERHYSVHTLLQTHGSFLLADGVDLATESERLGHSSVRVTADIYSHALRGRDQEAARRWDKFMRQHGSLREEPDKIV